MKLRLFSLKSSHNAGTHKRNDDRQRCEESIEGASSISSETSDTQDMLDSFLVDEIGLDFVNALPNDSESIFCGSGSITEIQPTSTSGKGNEPIPHRRSILKHISSFSGEKKNRRASMPLFPRTSVSFDQTVAFVTVPRLSDICSCQYPESLF